MMMLVVMMRLVTMMKKINLVLIFSTLFIVTVMMTLVNVEEVKDCGDEVSDCDVHH